ncbi:MAG: TolC family protein [Bacteroidales bacterium]|nr:TolC family protein [Bacteroidales bacterium]
MLSASAVEGQPGGLTLSSAIEKALQYNYGIRISRSDVEIAGINNNWGTAGRYPSIGFDASSNNTYNITESESVNRLYAGIGLNWTIFDGFRVNFSKGKLERLGELSHGMLGVVVETTIEDVVMAYYNVLLQQENLKVLKTVMKLSEDRYEYETARHSLGGTVTYNVLQAKNVYLNDKALFMTQEVRVRNTVRNLNFLLGVDPAAIWNFPDPFEPDTTAYVLGDLSSKMMTNNQTLKNQYTNLQLQKKEIALSKSALYPSLSLSSGLDENIGSVQFIGSTDALSAYGNLRLSWDIYTGGTRKRALEVARINEEIANVEIDQMEHALMNELLNLFDFYSIRIALLEVADESLEAAELNMSIADEKFRTGAINSFEYRDIQLIYLTSALRRLEAIYNLIGSRTSLTRLTGGFLMENTQPEPE